MATDRGAASTELRLRSCSCWNTSFLTCFDTRTGSGGERWRLEELAALEAEARREEGAPGRQGPRGTAAYRNIHCARRADAGDQSIPHWIRTEPMLGSVDLRPYIYFASERFALPIGVAQRLSPLAAQALRDLLGESEAAHTAAQNVR